MGHWYNDLTDFGPERIRRDPYYQEFYIPFGLHNLSCVKLEEQADSGIYLTVLNEVGAPLPTAQQHALLQRVSPHLLKAAKLFNKVNRLELELATRDLLLDHHPALAAGRRRSCTLLQPGGGATHEPERFPAL